MTPSPSGYRLLGPLKTGSAGTLHRGVVTAADGTTRMAAVARLTLAPTARFSCLDDVKAGAALAHPSVARLLAWSEANGELQVATELIDGADLRAVVERCRALSRPMPPALAAAVGGQLAVALSQAHRPQADRTVLVHRHLRPGQVMLTPLGNVKLLGLGTGRAQPTLGAGLPREHAGYLSPEQVSGLEPDPRADLFSLGVLLFELLTLQLPFPASDHLEPRRRAREWAAAPRPSTLAPGVSAEWDALLGQLLAGPPAERLPNADAVGAALQRLEGESGPARLAQFVRELRLGERSAVSQQAEQPSQLEAALSAFTTEPAPSTQEDPRAAAAALFAAQRSALGDPTKNAPVDPRALATDRHAAAVALGDALPEDTDRYGAIGARAAAFADPRSEKATRNAGSVARPQGEAPATAALDPLPPEETTKHAPIDPRGLAADRARAAAVDALPPEDPTSDPRGLAADRARGVAVDALPPEDTTIDPRGLATARARGVLPPEDTTKHAPIDPRALAADRSRAAEDVDALPSEDATKHAPIDPRALAADRAAAAPVELPLEETTKSARIDPRALAADRAVAVALADAEPEDTTQNAAVDPRALSADRARAQRSRLEAPEEATGNAPVDPRALAADLAQAQRARLAGPEDSTKNAPVDPRALAADLAQAQRALAAELLTARSAVNRGGAGPQTESAQRRAVAPAEGSRPGIALWVALAVIALALAAAALWSRAQPDPPRPLPTRDAAAPP